MSDNNTKIVLVVLVLIGLRAECRASDERVEMVRLKELLTVEQEKRERSAADLDKVAGKLEGAADAFATSTSRARREMNEAIGELEAVRVERGLKP